MSGGLESYLTPGEEVSLRNITVEYGGKIYELVITNKRIILYARRGLIFKSDDLISFKLGDIQNIKYAEEGLLFKKGTLIIDTTNRRIVLSGEPSAMKAAYQNIMQFWG